MRRCCWLLIGWLVAVTAAAAAEDPVLDPDPAPHKTADFTLNGGFNYAGLDAGAVIMASNKESKGTNNLLNADPDKYSLSPTASPSPWWFVIGLSEEILITSFVISNQEKYSSSVKRFSLHVSHTFYPDGSNTWRFMGEFERPRHRGTESFLIPDPAWGRYIKFQVLSTHGKEMYCTLTSIKVYGQTTIETLREDLALAQQHPNTVHDQQPPSSDPANCSVQDLESIFYISWTPSPTTTATTTTTAATAATTATESPVTDVSVIPPPSSSSSMDNIFKALMEKVKSVEAELATMRSESAKLRSQHAIQESKDQHLRLQLTRLEQQFDQMQQKHLAQEQLAILGTLVVVVWRLMVYCG